MALGAVLAAALTDHSVRAWALYIDALDVIYKPGAAGSDYGVPLDSIQVVEAPPGGVSSMTFTLEDPKGVLPIPADGAEIRFHNITNDHPEFTGYLQSVSLRPHESPGGRYMDIGCSGIEILLDWAKGSVTGIGFTSLGAQATTLVQYAGLGQIRTGQAAIGSNGSIASPIGDVGTDSPGAGTATWTTLRECILAAYRGFSQIGQASTLRLTVDFYRGLRLWDPGWNGSTYQIPDDFTAITISDTAAGALRAADLEYTLTPGENTRAVVVIGSGGTVYGPYTDGSGRPGETAILNDTSIASASIASSRATQYLAARSGSVRGSFTLETFAPGANNYRAGTRVSITDAELGLSLTPFEVGQITKRYHDTGLETWTVTFGAAAPSLVNALRRLTRDTLS